MMGKPRLNIQPGDKFNLLTVMEEVESRKKTTPKGITETRRRFKCQCDCGNITEINLINITTGKTKSCGCLGANNTDQTKHGLHAHRLNQIWVNMKQRCYNSKNQAYPRYGGRGISVCEEWINDLPTFFNWAIKNGWRRELQIDRIDNDGNYSPSNCRVTTRKINCNNRWNTVMVLFGNKPTPLSLACESLGLDLQTVYQKIKYRGYSFESAVKSLTK